MVGLEAWADSKLAGYFAADYMLQNFRYDQTDDLDMLDVTAQLWSEGWENRAKARAFCAEIARVRERLAERRAAQLNGEYDSEVWDDGDDEDDDYD